MARLSLFLPPFAGDYSGAASTLFGLDCLVILVDAGCCTRNYVEYDEPRWARRRKTAFSAQLRTLEAVMGDDARIVDQVVDAARELGPSCVAILGTPVPAITGMDLHGIAQAVEKACGVPALGIETCGFETYEFGVSRTQDALVRRFALPAVAAAGPSRTAVGPGDTAVGSAGHSGVARVAVWGLSPHDLLCQADAAAMLGWLADAGLEVVCAPGAGDCSLEELAAASGADASLVVSWSGLAAARSLERGAGVPYAVGRPWCPDDARRLAEAVRAPGGAGRFALEGVAPGVENTGGGDSDGSDGADILLLGEQVAMASLRPHLERVLADRGVRRRVVCATLFSADPVCARPCDLRLSEEAALVAWARGHEGFAWVGDPLFERIPGFAQAPHAGLPHEAVSSILFADRSSALAGEGALQSVLDSMDGLLS